MENTKAFNHVVPDLGMETSIVSVLMLESYFGMKLQHESPSEGTKSLGKDTYNKISSLSLWEVMIVNHGIDHSLRFLKQYCFFE